MDARKDSKSAQWYKYDCAQEIVEK